MTNFEGFQLDRSVADTSGMRRSAEVQDLELKRKAYAFIENEIENDVQVQDWNVEAAEKRADLNLGERTNVSRGEYGSLIRYLDTALYQQFVTEIDPARLDRIRHLMAEILTSRHEAPLTTDETTQDVEQMLRREAARNEDDKDLEQASRELRQALRLGDHLKVLVAVEEELSFNEMLLYRLEKLRRVKPSEYEIRRQELADMYGNGAVLEEVQDNLRRLWFSLYRRTQSEPLASDQEGPGNDERPVSGTQSSDTPVEPTIILDENKTDSFVSSLEAVQDLMSQPLDVFQEVFARRAEGYRAVAALYRQYGVELERLAKERPDYSPAARSNRAISAVIDRVPPDIKARIDASLLRNSVQASSDGMSGSFTVGINKLLSDWFECLDRS